MSLTEFVKEKEVKELFRRNFKMPSYRISHIIVAKPNTNNYELVGRAFDYLFKLYVKYYNIPKYRRHYYYLATINKYWKTLKFIDIQYNEFNLLLKGIATDNILKGSIIAAQISMRCPYNEIGKIEQDDIKDLRNLFHIIDIDEFTANFECIVNTNFDYICKLVKGAYCDLIIDNKLIDIKTTNHVFIDEYMYYQLIGYYLLSKLYGKNDIQEIGVYFSRYGVTYLYKIKELVNLDNIPSIINEFKEIARNKYGT